MEGEAYIKPLTEEYVDYLRDESRKVGFGASISFPKSLEEISEIMKYCNEKEIPVTVQGSRTGVGAAAVPFGGHILNLERMKEIRLLEPDEKNPHERAVLVGPGVTLKEINEYVRIQTKDEYFLPPDPTETTASAGGMIACNSSGARTYLYGPVRNYVNRVKVVFADGRVKDIPRGFYHADGRTFDLEIEGEARKVKLPFYNMPKVKNAAGYYIKSRMDLIDLFIGSEGTLGIVAEAELRLIPKPREIWGIVAFFRKEEQEGAGKRRTDRGVRFADRVRMQRSLINHVLSIEYFDEGSLNLLRERKKRAPEELTTPPIPKEYGQAVFVEVKGENREEVLERLQTLKACIEAVGGNPEDTWVAMNPVDFESFKQLRHATPECVNQRIDEIKKQGINITKLGSDMSVRDDRLEEIVEVYRHDLDREGLDYVIFGHIGNNHLHVNILSRSEEEYARGKGLFLKWASRVSAWNGSVSAEHGIGKLKKEYLLKMYGAGFVDDMRKVKLVLDPKGILCRDNVFDWKGTENADS